jgi:guanine deaminase
MAIYRSRIFTPIADPFEASDPASASREYPDGYLEVEQGRIAALGPWDELPATKRSGAITFGPRTLITPGFIDTHLHAPQLEMIGSYGGRLLEWLNRYTFPTEAKFSDPRHARQIAAALFQQLVSHGTLCALMFSTVHTEATEIFFEEAERARFRAIIGKTLMDRNAPEALLQDAETSYVEAQALMRKWHGRGLLRFAISPRFAPTSSPRLLEIAGTLRKEFPDAYVQTHISENVAEVEWVRELFPEAASYAEVYDRYGLLSERTVLAHGVHLTDAELELIAGRGARIAHCPNSNLFLGSGLFPLQRVRAHGVPVGLGTDIGAGTTPSMFNAMADAYKVQQVCGISLTPFQLWYMATLAGARVLSLDDLTGSLQPGKDADFLVINLEASSLLALRMSGAHSIQDVLAGLIFMGDERVVSQSFIRGEPVFTR